MSSWNLAKLKTTRCLSLIAILLFPATVLASSVRGCAAYSNSGALAQVTIDSAVHVAGTRGKDEPVKVDIPLQHRATDCKAFFSSDSKLLAIGLQELSHETNALVVVDVSTEHWLKSSAMNLKLAKDSRGELMGFIGDTNRLLILGHGVYFSSQHETTLFPVIVDAIREKVVTKVVPIAAKAFSRTDSVVDLQASTIWVPSDGDTPCLMRGYSLTESSIPGAKDIAIPNCYSVELLMSAGSHQIIAATHAGDNIQLHTIDTVSGLEKGAAILGGNGAASYLIDGKFSPSPDGRSVAVAVKRLNKGFLGDTRTTNELLLIDASSLAVQASVPFSEMPQRFAVSTGDESLEVAALSGVGWSVRTISLRRHAQ